MGKRMWVIMVGLAGLAWLGSSAPGAAQAPVLEPGYRAVHDIFLRHCMACHDAKEESGGLVLENHQTLMEGGENGPVVLPAKADESLLVQLLEHRKKPFMPKEADRLTGPEIALIRAWIEAGAAGPGPGEVLPTRLELAAIRPKTPPVRSILALAYEPKGKILAVAVGDSIELRSAQHRGILRRLGGTAVGMRIHALAFTADGARLVAGGGHVGRSGEVQVWNVADGSLEKSWTGHGDVIYALALAPDGSMVATGSYDQKVKLWDLGSGAAKSTLSGHSGAIFGLSFRPDGKILASASADRTLKLWDVATGQRMETLSESLKALHAVAFSPDGTQVAAAGADNRIRLWQVSPDAKEGTNFLRMVRFAHEGAILALAFSPDGQRVVSGADDLTVKVFQMDDLAQTVLLETQSDWPSALVWALEGRAIVVGRLDGALAFHDPATGKVMPPAKPELSEVAPRGARRGQESKIKLRGKNLSALTSIKSHHPGLVVGLLQDPMAMEQEAWVKVTPGADLAPGPYEISVLNEGGESDRLRIHVENLAQGMEVEPNDSPQGATPAPGPEPISFWGSLQKPGDSDHFTFDAKAGQKFLLDVAAKPLGSKANVVVTLLDSRGVLLESNNDFDDDPDSLLAHTFAADGRYVVRVSDLQATGSAEHFYRLSVGELAFVSGVHPLGVPAGVESQVRLLGFNLPADASVKVQAPAAGEVSLPLDANRYRSRKAIKVLVGAVGEMVEAEPNDSPDQATSIPVPAGVNGILADGADRDLFRLEAKAGQTWVIQTQAERLGSPADTALEILHADGRPVERLRMAAVLDSAITFRPVDANGGARLVNWEEMDLDQYLYMNGEVVKLFRAPRGPDSEHVFYQSAGRRRGYFDTSASAHALDETCYIVEPHPAGAAVPPSGLPVFPLYYANDDDAWRQLGCDSRIHFKPPADGTYLIRVRDSRGSGGGRFAYRMTVSPAQPDFQLSLSLANPTVPAGGGLAFSVSATRSDGFEGEITLDLSGLPPGFTAPTRLVIQAGHNEAQGTLYAPPDGPAPTPENGIATKWTARAVVEGKEVVKELAGFGKIQLGAAAQLRIWLEPYTGPDPAAAPGTVAADATREILIKPGLTPVLLRVQRSGHKGLVTFEVENLPHGVIVSDIGLSGVLIPEDQDQRQIFLSCSPWVAAQERYCHARANEADKPTSPTVLLRVSR